MQRKPGENVWYMFCCPDIQRQCVSEFEANAVKCCGHLWHDMKCAEHRLHVCWLFYDVTSCRDKPLTHAWKHTQEVVCSLLANIIY